METIFVVDGNWYCWRSWAVTRAVHRDFSIAMTSMLIGMISKDMAAVRAKKLLICFDGEKNFRYDLYPMYKSSRHEDKPIDNSIPGRENVKPVYEYFPIIKEWLDKIQFKWIQYEKYEADDCCCSAAKRYKDQYRVVVGTKDKDHYQYLDDNVCLYDSSFKVNGEPKPRYIDVKLAEELKGVSIKKMRLLQALNGDKVDDIPQLFSLRQSKDIINRLGSLKAAMNDEKYADSIKANLEAIKLNGKLVTLLDIVEVPDVNALTVPKLQLDDYAKQNLPKSYFNLIDFLHPKTMSLFS